MAHTTALSPKRRVLCALQKMGLKNGKKRCNTDFQPLFFSTKFGFFLFTYAIWTLICYEQIWTHYLWTTYKQQLIVARKTKFWFLYSGVWLDVLNQSDQSKPLKILTVPYFYWAVSYVLNVKIWNSYSKRIFSVSSLMVDLR